MEIASIVINSTLTTQGRIVVKNKYQEIAIKQHNYKITWHHHWKYTVKLSVLLSRVLFDSLTFSYCVCSFNLKQTILNGQKLPGTFTVMNVAPLCLNSELYVVYFPFPLQLKCKVILPVSDITGLFYYVPQAWNMRTMSEALICELYIRFKSLCFMFTHNLYFL